MESQRMIRAAYARARNQTPTTLQLCPIDRHQPPHLAFVDPTGRKAELDLVDGWLEITDRGGRRRLR